MHKHLVKFRHVGSEIWKGADKRTYKHAHHNTSHPVYTPLGSEVSSSKEFT